MANVGAGEDAWCHDELLQPNLQLLQTQISRARGASEQELMPGAGLIGGMTGDTPWAFLYIWLWKLILQCRRKPINFDSSSQLTLVFAFLLLCLLSHFSPFQNFSTKKHMSSENLLKFPDQLPWTPDPATFGHAKRFQHPRSPASSFPKSAARPWRRPRHRARRHGWRAAESHGWGRWPHRCSSGFCWFFFVLGWLFGLTDLWCALRPSPLV